MYLKSLAPAKLEEGPQEPEELVATIKQQQKEIEYLRRQRGDSISGAVNCGIAVLLNCSP